ncbi:unnamed protein product [Phaedon cochleariae]|uniref:Schwannomin interacting protein 1 C-terminal domain-containing protein n=1 Tax=Phaedon cochleariae TaxID=80249 RepID=A0A9N9S9A6_PHACE|nr:unnamed protein product [Phaedon cochleariae]
MKKSLSDTGCPTSDSEVPVHSIDTDKRRRNLQICFMNESLSDTDSPTSDSEVPAIFPHRLDTVTPSPSPSVPLDDN